MTFLSCFVRAEELFVLRRTEVLVWKYCTFISTFSCLVPMRKTLEPKTFCSTFPEEEERMSAGWGLQVSSYCMFMNKHLKLICWENKNVSEVWHHVYFPLNLTFIDLNPLLDQIWIVKILTFVKTVCVCRFQRERRIPSRVEERDRIKFHFTVKIFFFLDIYKILLWFLRLYLFFYNFLESSRKSKTFWIF